MTGRASVFRRAKLHLDHLSAPCETTQLGAIGHAAIVAEWATGKVQRVAIADGNGPAAMSTLLTGLQSPTAVASDATSILVADWATGTVYRVAAA